MTTLRFAQLDGLERTFAIQNYPYLCEVATRMALDNGMVNRHEPVENFYVTCDEVIASADTLDLIALNAWLSGLSDDQLDTLADGEERDMLALAGQGPSGGPDNQPLINILNDMFDLPGEDL